MRLHMSSLQKYVNQVISSNEVYLSTNAEPQETVLAKRYEVHGWESLDNIISAYEFPDLVVTVDFGSTPSDVNTGDPTTFMYVYPSFTNDDPKDVLLRSTPFAVSKGVNLALPLQLEVREVFGSNAAATFGLFPVSRLLRTSNMALLIDSCREKEGSLHQRRTLFIPILRAPLREGRTSRPFD